MPEVRAMRVTDWRRLTAYWQRHPPACELAEMASGWQAPPPETRSPLNASDLADLRAEAG